MSTEPEPTGEDADIVERTREIARNYARRHGFSPDSVEKLSSEPVLGPVHIDTDDGTGYAVRWIGGGRGGDAIQVEIVGSVVTVHGSIGDRGLPAERIDDAPPP